MVSVPAPVMSVLDVLRRNSYAAYLVGGCVRDGLMERVPTDWDVATSARPEAVCNLFARTFPLGQRFGTVAVLIEGTAVEVTTFRRDGTYHDARRPDRVDFVDELTEDLARRDFTVNAMAWNAEEGLVDPFGGQDDLRLGVLRCVGEAERRFSEDALRMLRAYRFAAQLGFSVAPETEEAIRVCAPLCRQLSVERVRDEWQKMMLCQGFSEMNRAVSAGLLDRFFSATAPDFAPLAVVTVAVTAPDSKDDPTLPAMWACVAALMERQGQPAAAFLPRWKLPKRTQQAACAGARLALEMRTCDPADITPTDWRRMCAQHGIAAGLCAAGALDVLRAEEKSASPVYALAALCAVLEPRPCLTVGALKLDGRALMDMGFSGSSIGQVQRWLLQQVLDRPQDNNEGVLRRLAWEMRAKNQESGVVH